MDDGQWPKLLSNVGGGSRRNKRSPSSPSSSAPAAAVDTTAAAAGAISKNQYHQLMGPQVSSKSDIIQNQSQLQAQDQYLNLGHPNISPQFGNLHPYNPTTTSSSQLLSAMEFLRSGFSDSRQQVMMMNSLPNSTNMIMNHPPPAATATAGLNFSLDGFDQNGGGGYNHQISTTMSTLTTSSNARVLFPFQDLKPISTSNNGELFDATKGPGESSTDYWGNGELGGVDD